MLECVYPITTVKVFIGAGYSFPQCCPASSQFITVTVWLCVYHPQMLRGHKSLSVIFKWSKIFLMCISMCVCVYIYMCVCMFLINISQEAGRHPIIQISFLLNFKELVVLKP